MIGSSLAEETFSPALRAFVTLAREKLYREPQELMLHPRDFRSGDHRLNPDFTENIAANAPRPAAVLVPIVAHDDPTVLLTERSKHLSTHAGQVAFPGGRSIRVMRRRWPRPSRSRRGDRVACAFCNAARLSRLVFIRYRFRIVPVVALIAPGFTLNINPREVDEVFEVPLAFLMARENHAKHSGIWKGVERHFYAMPFEKRNIWGATAGMIRNLYEKLYE